MAQAQKQRVSEQRWDEVAEEHDRMSDEERAQHRANVDAMDEVLDEIDDVLEQNEQTSRERDVADLIERFRRDLGHESPCGCGGTESYDW